MRWEAGRWRVADRHGAGGWRRRRKKVRGIGGVGGAVLGMSGREKVRELGIGVVHEL